MFPRRHSTAACFDTEQLDSFIIEERRERPHRVASAADARDEKVGKSAVAFEALLSDLSADDTLKVSHDCRIRMRAHDASEEVVRVLDVRHPISQRLVNGVLQRPATLFDAVHGRAEEPHPKYIEGLSLHVGGAHVHLDGQTEDCPDHRGGDAMLARACLCDHALLPHATGEEGLAPELSEVSSLPDDVRVNHAAAPGAFSRAHRDA